MPYLSSCTYDHTPSPDKMLIITGKLRPRPQTSLPLSYEAFWEELWTSEQLNWLVEVHLSVINEDVDGRSLSKSLYTCQLLVSCEDFSHAVFECVRIKWIVFMGTDRSNPIIMSWTSVVICSPRSHPISVDRFPFEINAFLFSSPVLLAKYSWATGPIFLNIKFPIGGWRVCHSVWSPDVHLHAACKNPVQSTPCWGKCDSSV